MHIYGYIMIVCMSCYTRIHCTCCMSMYIYIYAYTYTCVYIYIYMYTCICIYVYVYINVYIYMYMYNTGALGQAAGRADAAPARGHRLHSILCHSTYITTCTMYSSIT